MENNSGSLYGRNIGKCHWMDVNFVAYAELLIASSRMAFPSSIWPIHLSICQCGQFPLLLAHPIPPLIGTFVSSLIQPIFAHFILICTFFRHPTFKLILPRFTFNHFHNLLKIENGGKIVLSFLVLVIGVIGGLFAVIGAVYVWKLWQISRVKRRRRHGSSRRHSSFFIPSPHQIWLAKNAQQNSHQQKPNQQTSSLNPTILFVPPGHSQAPLIQHFQRQFSRNVDEEEEKGGGGQTRSLLLELANDTGKLAKMFPKIGPKTTNDETPESGQNIQQKIGGEIENAVEKRRQFSRMSASCQVDENDQIPLASLMMKEKGTQTSPAPMMANKNASIEQPPKSIRRQLPRPKEEDLSQSYFNSIRRHPQQHQRKKHLKQAKLMKENIEIWNGEGKNMNKHNFGRQMAENEQKIEMKNI